MIFCVRRGVISRMRTLIKILLGTLSLEMLFKTFCMQLYIFLSGHCGDMNPGHVFACVSEFESLMLPVPMVLLSEAIDHPLASTFLFAYHALCCLSCLVLVSLRSFLRPLLCWPFPSFPSLGLPLLSLICLHSNTPAPNVAHLPSWPNADASEDYSLQQSLTDLGLPSSRFLSSSSASSADGVRDTHTSGLGFGQGQAGLALGFGLGGSVDHTQTQSCLQA